MLEKNEEKLYFDAHFHWFYAKSVPEKIENDDFCVSGISCAHFVQEWEFQENQRNKLMLQDKVFLSFGIHPQCVNQNTNLDELKSFLIMLAKDKKLDAVGEMGFDFFTQEFKNNAELQEEIFCFQLELAKEFNLPIVIHCRKANEKLFEYSKVLKKLPAVLFHSFMGTPIEAKSLLSRGINAYFSFGKQMLNNNKKVIACVKELPLERLLCETDAPFQTLKDEKETYLSDIKIVYDAAWKIKKEEISDLSFEDFCKKNYFNFPIRPAGKNL